MPQDATDNRIAEQEKRFLEANLDGNLRVKMSRAQLANRDQDAIDEALLTEEEREDSPKSPFADPEIEQLQTEALAANQRYQKIRYLIRSGERKFLSAQGLLISISKYLIYKGLLQQRLQTQILVYEPLRTRVIQKIYDSSLTGYPERDSLRALINREQTQPG